MHIKKDGTDSLIGVEMCGSLMSLRNTGERIVVPA